MSGELLVDLLTARFELINLILSPTRVVVIIAHHLTVTIEAKGHGIMNVIRSSSALGNEVMDFDVNTTWFLAKAAMSVTPKKSFGSGGLVEWHLVLRV